jgi:lactate dehydrogenase-like 2-hydroxyacid dehydrogenase
MDRVVLTPHIGTSTLEARVQMAQAACQNIIDYFEGRGLKYIVNPEVLNRLF